MDKEDIAEVMAKALTHLERIAEHLREQECNEAANEIAKQTYLMLEIFNNATADWDIEKGLIKSLPSLSVASSCDPEGRQIKNGATIGESLKKIQAGSWAAIAATPTPEGNRVVKFRPSDAIKRPVADHETPIKRHEARVLWIKPWDMNKRTLNSITRRIDQGPLLSMAHAESDRAVCIIFQHAHHARGLQEADEECRRKHNYGLFGPESELIEGQPYPYDEALQRMESPANERRRLTFARQRLFADGMTEAQFKRDIAAIVGEDNVELIWLFNSGNGMSMQLPSWIEANRPTATVVFAATVIARLVRDEFRNRARKPGPYQNVQVTFSHDPCERPLNLITQMPQNGVRSSVCLGASNRPEPSSPPRRRNTVVDHDGWQTVGRRK